MIRHRIKKSAENFDVTVFVKRRPIFVFEFSQKTVIESKMAITSAEKFHTRPRYQTTRRKRPKHMVLFMVTAPYT